ncbi:hypothetical protein [Bartonella ancashensis]|uniref:Uncharacterized protein n=1 Tax=Bartonella ancashensis TaxID=1318743 RepID=A0A0M4M3C3_9HYPH|nr:hypothetical protein [Bartonella ancashensis]ALE03499.1 hypothetical protein PU02_0685 [Bartonella ancashensis]
MNKKPPKSYMSEEEREKLRARGISQNNIYVFESRAADKANDDKTSWEWLAMAELPAPALLGLKKRCGAQFIRDMGFPTRRADAEYGQDWLDRDIIIASVPF